MPESSNKLKTANVKIDVILVISGFMKAQSLMLLIDTLLLT